MTATSVSGPGGAAAPQPGAATPLAPLWNEPHRFALFAALRLIEQSFPSRPRLGHARKASDDPVRLAQRPSMSFAPSDVSGFRAREAGRPVLEELSFGIFGPNGALPLHLTEFAYERRHQRDDTTFPDFVNAFQHRLISLFYRAWADSEPAVHFDRPASDQFALRLGAVLGIGNRSARNRDAVPDRAKLSRAPLFAPQCRSAEGLEAVLAGYFRLPVKVRQFVGAWMSVPSALYCRLGRRDPAGRIGAAATLGAMSWQCQHKFEIVIGPLDFDVFNRLLPGSRGVSELHALVRLYTTDEWTWQLRLLLRDVEVPGMRLGKIGQLGWTTWLGGRRSMADDVVIQEPQPARSADRRSEAA